MNDSGGAAGHTMAARDPNPRMESTEQIYQPDEKDTVSLSLANAPAAAAASGSHDVETESIIEYLVC